MCVIGQACVRFFPHPFVIPRKTCIFTPEFRRHSGGVRKDFINPKSVIVYSNILYTFAFVNDIKKWNKAVRSFVVKTVSNV